MFKIHYVLCYLNELVLQITDFIFFFKISILSVHIIYVYTYIRLSFEEELAAKITCLIIEE